MSVRMNLSFRSQRFSTPLDRSREPCYVSSNSTFLCFVSSSSASSLSLIWSRSIDAISSSIAVPKALNQDRSLQELDDSPASVQLTPISSETQFDRVIVEAQQLEQPVIIVWMASWCRKCVYLKPKLEKLAADYYSRMRFYCIDVNTVPHKLVTRAGVTKMPTIQLWKDSKKQAEVIGGHKSYLVVNEVCQMIENECDL